MTSTTMIVRPHQGVADLRFGMDRAGIQRAMRLIPNRFKRSAYGLEEDMFEDLGLFVMYDEHGLCSAISVARRFGTEWDYDGYRLFANSARAVRAWATSRDPEIEISSGGFTSKSLGLGMGADWLDEPDLEPDELDDEASSFIVFRPGYWEQERERIIAAGLIKS